MIGSILLGDTKLSAEVKQIIESKKDCYTFLQNSSSLESAIELISTMCSYPISQSTPTSHYHNKGVVLLRISDRLPH